ncbi:hypothetical protein [Marinospirillum alkaliphilum]|uniref:Cytochrome oxidase Cu insertion factor, SCO1/SenC/PrrC family n=1 Tax=Marinospirillum alkaliphilum DSM 21637 TaxID=1122209 RepID=A0A1K1W019_9GAMM|nr:hypothetical protein [Marinospirillum alkaliphilum]SFX30575.1 hypothetical protein SAMN02745752_01183 [Marinospirillum alkaliphilum DSM 21637]
MKNRIKLVLLMLLLAAPMLVSGSMYALQLGIPEKQVARGALLPDLQPLQQWPLDWQASGEWWLVWIADAPCQATCQQLADQWWRVHRALGREADRVYRLRIEMAVNESRPLTEALPGERVVHWQGNAPDWAAPGQTWLVDPEGRVVLAYDADAPAADLHRDLMRLLRVNR